MEKVQEILLFINGIVWGYPMLLLIVGTGLFLMFALGFIPVRKFFYGIKEWITSRKEKDDAAVEEGDVSSYNALMIALSATIGTGNILGVATALSIGGRVLYFGCGLLRL